MIVILFFYRPEPFLAKIFVDVDLVYIFTAISKVVSGLLGFAIS